jgi:hypothetical protein
VPNYVLGLQAGVATGHEHTFDGQPIEAGVHLRWSFVAALGFPPGGFWLCRRKASGSDSKRIPPPVLTPCDLDNSKPNPTFADNEAVRAGLTGNPPCTIGAKWGKTNGEWEYWGEPFTPPVTRINWPARYFGAPDPATTPALKVLRDDIEEARKRLGILKLVAGMTPQREIAALEELHAELIRLVKGFPTILLGKVSIPPSPAGANAPKLNLTLMEQLLLLALDPYFARVMGLYFVDKTAQPNVKYDYAIVGLWGSLASLAPILYPGLAPAAPLARGSFAYNGVNIQSASNGTSLWRWLKFDPSGNYNPQIDPSAPPVAGASAATAITGISQGDQPAAMLMAVTQSSGWGFAPPPQVTFSLNQPAQAVDVSVAGTGAVQAFSGGTLIATANYSSSQLAPVNVAASSQGQPIDQIVVTGSGGWLSECIAIAFLRMYPIGDQSIGDQFAIIHAPGPIHPPAAPRDPVTTYRRRHADIDPNTLTLIPHSLYDVAWPAPDTTAQQTGNPISDPAQLPPPIIPIGYVAQRADGNASSAANLPGWTTTRSIPTPANSGVTTPNMYRLVDSLRPDPNAGYAHRVGAFDIFGVRGAWSQWSAPRGVERIAAPPSALRIVSFDNSSSAGGAPAPDGSAWVGGTLTVSLNWAGSAYMLYPDAKSARISVQTIDTDGNSTGVVTTQDVVIPPPAIQALTIDGAPAYSPAPGGNGYVVTIQTTPALTALGPDDPSQVLMITLPGNVSDRYTVRPALQSGSVVATISAGDAARVISSNSDYNGQPAYLVSGWGTQLSFPLPISVPIDQTKVRFQVTVDASLENPYQSGDQIVDPNGVNAPRPMPVSAPVIGQAVQRLVPPTPPIPTHSVDHLYYDPADITGNAAVTLPFTLPSGSGIGSYLLERAPVRSIALTDVQRRIGLIKAGTGSITDNNPVVLDGGTPRADLAAWIGSLTTWIGCYNAIHGKNFTPATVLNDPDAQRAFIEHFYNGLLDDELRALADVPLNSPGYVRLNGTPPKPGVTLSDSVLGTGFGRNLYRLWANSNAGVQSQQSTQSFGPWYIRIVTPPRPPVLYKVQPTQSSVLVAWSLDANPDVAAYLVYRAPSAADLADLRFFGADWTHPAPLSQLPSISSNPKVNPSLQFVQGTGAPPNIDPRIIGFVPDPRLCARDYQSSDMAEIALPSGPPPDTVNGIYRLTDYQASKPALSQPGFNYWTPPPPNGTGIAQLIAGSPTQSRLTGLRVGLGRGVPVVVVATWGTTVKVLGLAGNRRAAFTDGVNASNQPLDPNAIAAAPAPSTTALNYYAVVAIDIYGNRSAPSSVFASQMLLTPVPA